MGDLVHKPGTPPTVGIWDEPLLHPNLEDAPIAHSLDALSTVPFLQRAEAAYRAKFRLKSWQYMTATTPELFIAFVVGTAGYASNGFVYAAELGGEGRGTTHEKFAFMPLTIGTTVSPTSVRGTHKFTTRGLTVEIDNLDEGRRFAVRIDARTTKHAAMTAALDFVSADGDQHLASCVPLPNRRWSYTHKLAGFRVNGNVTIAGKPYTFEPASAFGTLDFTKQYAQRHSVWKWIAFAGLSDRGRLFGLNLVDPTPDAPVSENAVWVDGVREALTGVRLSIKESAWSLIADNVDITMTRVAQVSQHLDTPLLKHTLHHTIGSFSGRVRTRNGHVHDIENVVGIAEDFDNLW